VREVAIAVPRERPILFQGAMVRALLAGTKTQTRRAIKPQPPAECGIHYMLGNQSWLPPEKRTPLWHTWEAWGGPLYDNRPPKHLCGSHDVRCPYGSPGDRLWVREAFMHEPADYCWEASVSIPSRPASTVYRADFPDSKPGEGWKPSIHLPRKLSRIDLEITEVRVQRLQEISEEDAIAEGIEQMPCAVLGTRLWRNYTPGNGWTQSLAIAQNSYRSLWELINGAGSWDANPWVWAVSFRVVAHGVPPVEGKSNE
jgi:hypothetical protein